MQFSIIIPAKNEEANIGRCLDSISQVDWDSSQYEVIVVDNGSIDKTVEIAIEKGATVYSKPGLTISGLRNYGSLMASGKILAFLDADCAVSKQWLEAASRYLANDSVAAFGSPVIVPEGGTWIQNAWFNVRGKPDQVIDVEWLESANLFVKSSAFNSVNGFDETLITCEDYDLTQRLKVIGRIISDHRIMAIHYREPATIKEFFNKELWRGRNNYSGIFTRSINRSEIPSLIFPLIYLSLFFASFVACIVCVAYTVKVFLLFFLFLLLSWQLPILLVSFRKNKSNNMLTTLQLLILFNVYFLARGFVVLR